MPTHPDILNELAARYGGCDPSSTQDVERFYTESFRKLPRQQRDRISFEIVQRDGAPGHTLASNEIDQIDRAFAIDDEPAKQWSAVDIRRIALVQAAFSAAIYLVLASLKLAPEVVPGVAGGAFAALDLPLLGVGLLGSVAAFLFERRITRRRGPSDG